MDLIHTKELKKFGQNIKRFRLALGLSQEDLALKAGIERSYMGKIERGEGNPSLRRIISIAKTLRVQPYELLKFK